MSYRRVNRVQQQWLISVLLVVLGVRALIPAGFMPSNDKPFTLEICPDGFPAQLLHSAVDPHAASHAGHHMHPGMDMSSDMSGTAGDAPQHSGHERGYARAEHCVFAAVAHSAPPPQIPLLLTPIEVEAAPQVDPETTLIELTRYRVQQPRGPPQLS